MKTFQKIYFSLLYFGILSSCSRRDLPANEGSVIGPCDASVDFNIDGSYEHGNTEGFSIVDWRIENTCMHVIIMAMGVDGTNWVPKLIDPLLVLDSDPPKHTLRFVLENNEEEHTEIIKEFSFELVPYADGESTIEYTFDNVGETFFYSY